MTYEKLFSIVGLRLETVDEAMQMLTPEDCDCGQKDYNRIVQAYDNFAQTGDLKSFEFVANQLSRITGAKF